MVTIDVDIGLTYDDVLLKPRKTNIVSRKDVSLETRLTKNIRLNNPLTSANMDSVTEAEMAIAMAREGGIGIIHRYLTIEQQVEEIKTVKRSRNAIIEEPYILNENNSLRDVQQFNGQATGFLVVDNDSKISGILTKRDMKWHKDLDTKIKELMTPKNKLITAMPGTSVEQAMQLLKQHKIEKLPLVDAHGRIHGLITASDIDKQKNHPNAAIDKKGRLLVGAAVGVKDDVIERTDALLEAGADAIVIDIAHGHSENLLKTARLLKKEFSDIELIGGNVATAEGAEELISVGVDAIKVGVGGGAVCFEEDALITMSDYSVKKINEVCVGDYIITHNNRKRAVTKKYVRKHSGEVCEIKINGSPNKLHITPNHPMLAITFNADKKKISKYGAKYYFEKEKYNKGLNWVEAGELSKGDIVVVPRSTINKIEQKVFDLSEFVPNHLFDEEKIWSNKIGFNPNNESHVDLAEKFNTTPRIIGNIVHGKKSVNMELNRTVNQYMNSIQYEREISANQVNRFVKLDEDLAKLFGYFVAEGFVSGNKNNRQLSFAFSNTETEYHQEIINLVQKIFSYSNSTVTYHKTKNSATVHIYSHIIASFFERIFPLGSRNKKIPAIIFNQDNKVLQNFLKGAWNGDGSIKDKARATYHTASPSLAFQISEVLTMLGFMPSVRTGKPADINWATKYQVGVSGKQFYDFMKLIYPEKNIQETKRKAQQVWADDEYIYYSVISSKKIEKETTVYNLEVDEDNSYLANRIAVHNCTTRIVTGAGYPQLSAVIEAVSVAKKYNIPVIADGGIKNSGDIVKALACGAETIMAGNLFAGTDEAPGKVITRQGKRFKIYRGMASFGANAGRALREIGEETKWEKAIDETVPEGVESTVVYKGPVNEIIFQLLGGVRSGMSYCGARTIPEIHANARFVKISPHGVRESNYHDVNLIE
ncbi:MAG: IMP dehydrogenase [archaeon]|nr:IMP dehydrogenase [archaeon]